MGQCIYFHKKLVFINLCDILHCMEFLNEVMPLFSAIIAFCSVFGALGLLFRILLNPVKTDIESLKKEISGLKQGQKELGAKIDQLIAKQA